MVLNQNPEGAFTTSKGNPVKSQDAMEKLDKMAQNLGELIDKENELLKGAIKNVTAKQKWFPIRCVTVNVSSGGVVGPSFP